MSDFDDEPTEGLEATDEPAGAADDPVDTPPRKKARSEPVPDDDWDDEWDDDDDGGRGGKRDLTVVYAIVAATIVIVLAVVLTQNKDDGGTSDGGGGGNAAAATTTADPAPVKNWQGPVADAVGENGAEAQKRAESGEGVYIWTDFGGWHVRVNGADPVTVTVAAGQVKQAGESDFKTEAVLDLPAGDGKTGADLDLGSSESATFTVAVNGANIPADQIFLGGAEGVADANPVAFTKS